MVGFHVVLILSGPRIVCANFVIEYSKQIHLQVPQFQVTTLLTFENGWHISILFLIVGRKQYVVHTYTQHNKFEH